MPTAEQQLLSRIVRTGDMGTVLAWGVNNDDFLTDEGKVVWLHLCNYYTAKESMRSVPGTGSFAQGFPNYPLVDDSSMTTDALCLEVRKLHLQKMAEGASIDLAQECIIDPLQATSRAQAKLNQIVSLGYSKNTDVGFIPSVTSIASTYMAIKQGATFSRCPWPWKIIDDKTMGIQPDDYIVLYGRPKSMKSWVLAYMISYAYDMGKKIIVYTKEMTPENIFKRVMACIIGLPYDNLRTGTLNPHHEAALMEFTNVIQSGGDEHLRCLSGKDAAAGTDTISWLEAKAEKFKPDLIFIDGLYLLSSETKTKSDHERVMQISRSARTMQLNTGIPLIATMQANRKAAQHSEGQLDEIAYSDAIGQDATCAIRVINEKARPTIAMILAGSREFSLHGFRIGGEPATDFSLKCELTEKDIKKAQEQDASMEEAEKASAHTKARKPMRKPETGAASDKDVARAAVDSQMDGT
jgi:replicative DNA helicase